MEPERLQNNKTLGRSTVVTGVFSDDVQVARAKKVFQKLRFNTQNITAVAATGEGDESHEQLAASRIPAGALLGAIWGGILGFVLAIAIGYTSTSAVGSWAYGLACAGSVLGAIILMALPQFSITDREQNSSKVLFAVDCENDIQVSQVEKALSHLGAVDIHHAVRS